MSYTTLYTINPDGTLNTWTDYRNSHGSAAAVWAICSPKYISNVASYNEDYNPNKRHWMLDNTVLKELWTKANAGELSPSDRRVVWTTYDRACIRIDDVPLYAQALREFAEEHGPAWTAAGRVFHIPTMAADLDTIYEERHEHGWRGVAWNQTSVSDTWYQREPTEEQRRELVLTRLQDVTPALDEDQILALAELVMELIDDALNGEDRVEDNVDVFGCTWLPGEGVNTL